MTVLPQRPAPFPPSVETPEIFRAAGRDFRLLSPLAAVIGYLAGYAAALMKGAGARAADAWRAALESVAEVPEAVRALRFRRDPAETGKLPGVCVTPNALKVPDAWRKAG